MSVHSITLNVPDPLYHRLTDRAQQCERSVEAEALDAIASAVPLVDALPSYLQDALAPLNSMDEEHLLRAARGRLSPSTVAAMEALLERQQREPLTAEESQLLTLHVREYEQVMLIRAQAAALLQQCGHDVSGSLFP